MTTNDVSVGVSPSGAPTPQLDALRADPAVAKAIDDYALQYAVPRRSFDALLAAVAAAATAQTVELAAQVADREKARSIQEARRAYKEQRDLTCDNWTCRAAAAEQIAADVRALAGAPGGRAPTTTPTTTHTEAGDDA